MCQLDPLFTCLLAALEIPAVTELCHEKWELDDTCNSPALHTRQPWPGVAVQSLPGPRYRLEPLEVLMRCYCQEPSGQGMCSTTPNPICHISIFNITTGEFWGGCILFCIDPRDQCHCLKTTSARLWHWNSMKQFSARQIAGSGGLLSQRNMSRNTTPESQQISRLVWSRPFHSTLCHTWSRHHMPPSDLLSNVRIQKQKADIFIPKFPHVGVFPSKDLIRNLWIE